jgi:hypothetical protein
VDGLFLLGFFFVFEDHVQLLGQTYHVVVQHTYPVDQSYQGLVGLAQHGLDLLGHPGPNVVHEVSQAKRGHYGESKDLIASASSTVII